MGFTFLAKKYFGGNYNQELKFLMMNHIFQGVDRIFFSVGSNNHRSRKAMVKIGGQLLTTE